MSTWWSNEETFYQVDSLISSIHRIFSWHNVDKRHDLNSISEWEILMTRLPFPFSLIASCILMKTWIQLKHTTCYFSSALFGQHCKEIDDDGQYFSMLMNETTISKCIHAYIRTPLTPLMIITHPVLEIDKMKIFCIINVTAFFEKKEFTR